MAGIEMPTPCVDCGEICDLNDLWNGGQSREDLICIDCKHIREIEEDE